MTPTQITYENGNQVTLEIPDVEKGDIKNIRIDGRAVSSGNSLLLVVCIISIASLVSNLITCGMIYANNQVLDETVGRLRYMIDVRPGNRERTPYDEYENANKLPTEP